MAIITSITTAIPQAIQKEDGISAPRKSMHQPFGIGLAAFEVLSHLWVLMIGLANSSARLLDRR
jgi:hypothetical protein